LADLKKSSPLKPLGQMNWNLVGSIYGRSQSVNKHGRHMVLYKDWSLLLETWVLCVSAKTIPTKGNTCFGYIFCWIKNATKKKLHNL
jgi:hypothetical protein